MDSIAKVLKLIQSTGSYNDKLYLLKKNEYVPGLKEVLQFIYNPYVKTCIAKTKLAKATPMGRGNYHDVITPQQVIAYYTKHRTGGAADVAYGLEFVDYVTRMHGADSFAVEVAKALITQSLKIGITATSLNTVYGPTFIPRIGCMLGTLVEHAKPKWPMIVSEKLDGARRILVKEDGVCSFYTRSGHEDNGLAQIMPEAEFLPDNTVYDGELLAIGDFDNCIEQRIATNSIASSGGMKVGLTFNMFDMVPLDEFKAGASTNTALVRKITLGALMKDPSIGYLTEDAESIIISWGLDSTFTYIKNVPTLGLVNTMDEVNVLAEELWARGREGVMLNTVSGLYTVKTSRTKELLKVKNVEEMVLPIIDYQEGEGKYAGMLGAVIIEYKGNRVGVGSGFSRDQRIAIWANPIAYIGRSIELDTFGESKNALGIVSLNCPIFKRMAGDI